ncbi:hypothetical protein DDB_G0276955 [Dictyostelium discoideum AX4]|uniref:GCN5-related N-acetyltransferase Rv2170-like domain-containing protein n=1 Tax=Dictyostelium discoideum TaxID=44689 RepID=Q86KF4_DICDI|nr:hypothetical protein DDB_G0276955 [Dictyostelium discoideum AX4]EAL68979.1 hypothetical protein DDB_G0276955 [Dictyostelium discoideum AX4]|eukprot:XP_642986.1 hypothetical protein DDB_G0276955 [Dictyostelium discoideum AX4]
MLLKENNKKSILIHIKDKSFFKKTKGFPQFDFIENQIKIGLYEFFTDNYDSPSVIVSISLITNFIKLFTLNNENLDFEIVKNVIKSIDWKEGYFNSFNAIEMEELLKKTNLNDAILNHHFSNEINTFYFGDIENPILVKFIEKYFQECGFEVKTFPFNHYIIDINNIDNKIKIISKLNSIISNDNNIVPLSKSDAYFINDNYKYKTEFSINEIFWAIENGLAFGYKINNYNNNNNYNNKNKNNNKVNIVFDENDEKEKKVKNSNDLVCWNFIKSDGKSSNLYTLPEFRCKGVALKVKAKLTLSSIENNIIPLCSTSHDNINSISLIEKLGFKYSYSMAVMVISKNKINFE